MAVVGRVVLSRCIVVMRMARTRMMVVGLGSTIGMLQRLDVRNGRIVRIGIAPERRAQQSDGHRENDDHTDKSQASDTLHMRRFPEGDFTNQRYTRLALCRNSNNADKRNAFDYRGRTVIFAGSSTLPSPSRRQAASKLPALVKRQSRITEVPGATKRPLGSS